MDCSGRFLALFDKFEGIQAMQCEQDDFGYQFLLKFFSIKRGLYIDIPVSTHIAGTLDNTVLNIACEEIESAFNGDKDGPHHEKPKLEYTLAFQRYMGSYRLRPTDPPVDMGA